MEQTKSIAKEELPSPPVLERSAAMHDFNEIEFKNEKDKKLYNLLLTKNKPAKPPRKKRKRKLPPSDSKSKKEEKLKRMKKQNQQPKWLSPTAVLSELITVLHIEGDSVIFNIEDQPEPYNQYSTKIIRQFAKKARQYPQLCYDWNKIACRYNNETIVIPLNGRHATRSAGDLQNRWNETYNAFMKLQIPKPGSSMLKDLGYGANAAYGLLTLWSKDDHVPERLPESLQPTLNQQKKEETDCLNQKMTEQYHPNQFHDMGESVEEKEEQEEKEEEEKEDSVKEKKDLT
jgi:hypothetical protein